ncbi:MAG: hypothetical protein ABSC06_29870 [Rhodopila sp.]
MGIIASEVMTITHHHPGHSQAISRTECRAGAEQDDQQYAPGIKSPVDERHVDLTGMRVMGVPDGQPRKQTEPYCLGGEGEGAGDERLGGDDGGHGREQDHGVDHAGRHEAEEQVAAGHRCAAQQVGTLPEIVQQQGGIHHRKPACADWTGAKMAHIRVHRFPSGDDQHQGGEYQQRFVGSGPPEEGGAADGIERGQDFRVVDSLDGSEDGDDSEPDEQDGAEDPADPCCAVELDGEKRGQEQDSDWNDDIGECRCGNRDALDGGQNADGGRNKPVTKQQSGAKHQGPQENPRAAPPVFVEQAVKRKDAALAVVLCAKDENGVFDCDDDGDGPDHQGNAAQHVVRRQRQSGTAEENLVERVKR